MLRLPAFFRVALILGSGSLPARTRAEEPSLRISYNGTTTHFSAADLAGRPHQNVTAFDAHEKKNHPYVGVPVRDLLAQAGVPLGEKLRGKNLRLGVVVHCRDTYDIVFALAEFDAAFNSRAILLVDRQDGEPLADGLGPVRILVPGDQRPARWARMVNSLEVVAVSGSDSPP